MKTFFFFFFLKPLQAEMNVKDFSVEKGWCAPSFSPRIGIHYWDLNGSPYFLFLFCLTVVLASQCQSPVEQTLLIRYSLGLDQIAMNGMPRYWLKWVKYFFLPMSSWIFSPSFVFRF